MRRLATTLRTTRSFASAPATPRIAICGAGVSGLTLAGILSNGSYGTRDVQLTVFERARRDRDQGYGLDLDEHGQEALVRAGVYDRYWDISYPYSDTVIRCRRGCRSPWRGSRSSAWRRSRRPGTRGSGRGAAAARAGGTRRSTRASRDCLPSRRNKYYWAGLCLKNVPTCAKGDDVVPVGSTCVSRSPSSMPTMDISSFSSTATGWPCFTSFT